MFVPWAGGTRLIARRTVYGYPCNHFWLQSEFRSILEEVCPPNYRRFKYSGAWAQRFCIRYVLTTQVANNIKAHDVAERVEKIQTFHCYRAALQDSLPQTELKFGRFGAHNMFHVDQVPLPFASPSGRTLNPKGSKSCRIAGPNTSGMDKRQATLQLWICADGNHQCVRPALIFRGTSGPRSKVPWPKELAIYDELDNVRVHFQKNAWADGKFCQDDILEVASDMYAGGVVGEVLIGMDNHSAQKRMKWRHYTHSAF